jgi:hypothetical protein
MPPESPFRPDLLIWLDPTEAESGTTKTITIPGEPPRTLTVNVPSGVQAGMRLRLPGVGKINPLTGQPNDLFVKVLVRSTNKRARQIFAGVGAIVVLGLIVWPVVASLSGGSSANTAGPTSSLPLPTFLDLPSFSDTPQAGSDLPTVDSGSVEPPIGPPLVTTPVYDISTCLSGTLPNSTVSVPVGSDVTEVACTSPDAHYRVIQDIPGTTDLNRCDSNPQTQYEFSSEEDINGLPTNQYVYCLVGIGSYGK